MAQNPGRQYEDSLLRDWSEPPPWSLFEVFNAFVGLLYRLLEGLLPPFLRTIQMCSSFIPSSWLSLTAQLGIPDLLRDGPKSASEISQELGGLREDDIYRGLRLLVNNGFYSVIEKKGQPVLFRNNAASAALRSDHPNSIRHLAMTWHGDNYQAFTQETMLWHLQQKGGDETPCAFEHATNQEFWTYLKKDPAKERNFMKAMENGDIGLTALVKDFRWKQFSRVLDIGGANGTVVAALAQDSPTMEGVLFDQPQVIEGAAKLWEQKPHLKELQSRVKLIGGDFFKPETIPAGRDGDVYVLRTIIHDWSDDASIAILKAIRQAIGSADARLALVEICLLPEFGAPRQMNSRVMLDMLMHAVVRGKERTAQQWAALFHASGFQLIKCHPTRGAYFVVEAKPV